MDEMRYVGRPSWLFGHAVRDDLHEVLYVRDALSLPVANGSDLPPRLIGVDAVNGLLGVEQRVEVAENWLGWWTNVLAMSARHQLRLESLGDDRIERVRTVAGERRQVFDPPDWASLSDQPTLRYVAQELLGPGQRWPRLQQGLRVDSDRTQFPWAVVKAVAESLIDELQVSPDALQGCALVLHVEGAWWHRASPGVVLCSYDAAEDPAVSELIVHEAFISFINDS